VVRSLDQFVDEFRHIRFPKFCGIHNKVVQEIEHSSVFAWLYDSVVEYCGAGS